MSGSINFASKCLKKFNSLFLGSRNDPEFDYDNYWKVHYNPNQDWSCGISYVDHIIQNFPHCAKVLDAGCGMGEVVRALSSKNIDAYGHELSRYIVTTASPDLVKSGRITIGSLANIPYPDNQFDLVTSFDVLEHIPEESVRESIKEIVRVASKHIFLTICLRPSSNNNAYHCTLRSRDWWEQQFVLAGAKVNQSLVNKLQKKEIGASMIEVLSRGPTKAIMHEIDWFVNEPPYDLNGELEPWFFCFEK